MAFVDTHIGCPKCDSSDAFAINDNGWGHCFSCGSNIPPENSGSTAEVIRMPSRATPPKQRSSDTEAYNASEGLIYTDLRDRKINYHTCEVFGVGLRGDDIIFPYNRNQAAKVRSQSEKKFKIEGQWSAGTELFGQDKFPSGGKTIIVTEGEFDAMSAFQMLTASKVACVSVRNGAQTALKDCEANYEYLDSFDHVVFHFDSDKPGIEAQAQCAELFSHKASCVVPVNGLKDASDFLQNNRSAEYINAVRHAERYTPDGIVAGSNLYDEVMKPIQKSDVDYPFGGLNKLTYGLRKEELVTVTAGSGLGKSQFLREVIWHIIQNTQNNIGLMFLEESTRKTGLSLMSLAANKPLHLPDTIASQQEKDDAFNQTLGTDRLYLFDHFGSSDVDNIVNRVRYLAKVARCDYVFVDHISIIVSAQSNGDERKAIDEIMTKLRMLVQETGICLVCVSHLRRPENKGHEEGAATSLSQLRGSASIAQLSDMVLGLERDGQAEDTVKRNTTYVRVLKNRFCGTTGKACALLYNGDTGRMKEIDEEAL